jgi:hypothetical protein
VSWQTVLIGVVAALWFYSTTGGDGSLGGSFGTLEGNEWAYGAGDIQAAKDGVVLDVGRHNARV